MRTGVLLLAAGASRRFGGDKRRALLADGTSLLQQTVDRIGGAGLPLLVCLARGDAALARQLGESGIASRICLRASEGMGASLAEGMHQLPQWDGVIIALADMPWVLSSTYQAIAAALTEQGICVPYYKEQRGNPVGFGAAFFSQLAGLDGDRGARELLRSNAAALVPLAVADPGILRDVDEPTDLLLSPPVPE